jgi:hypothetical protein
LGETRRRIEFDELFLSVNEELTVKDKDTGVSLSKLKPSPKKKKFQTSKEIS